MKKLLRMICLTLALCMLAGSAQEGRAHALRGFSPDRRDGGARHGSGTGGLPAGRRQTIPTIPSGPAWRTTPTAKGAWTWTHMTRP